MQAIPVETFCDGAGYPLALRMEGVSKRYPGTLAVDRVDFDVRVGEVHAIMGENGAGKSTLMKMLAGAFGDYTGRIVVGGREVALHRPAAAKARGIEMIHQELSLAQPLSIAENLLAGRLPSRRGWLARAALLREARLLLARVGLEDLDPQTPVEDISQHEAQLVEIAKALGNVPCILVMDEPTTALSAHEVERLFEIIGRLRRQGLAIVYISHHLPEVLRIADRITVLRDGRRVAQLAAAEADAARIVELMIGRAMNEMTIRRARAPGPVRFEACGLSRFGFFHRVSFTVREGEIVGIGGLAGAGRSELARSMCGIDPLDEGALRLDGRPVAARSMAGALRAGLAYVTEDRQREGLALRLRAVDNVLASLIAKRSARMAPAAARSVFHERAAALRLDPLDPSRAAGQFSGGNQQKLLLAKSLAVEPTVLILDEPTRGVDVGAKQILHEAIGRLADEGKCIILISSDLPELVGLADRVIIMRKGRFTREMQRGEFDEDRVLLAANADD